MEGRIGWGVIGCGWVARDYALPAIAASAVSHLAAVYDPVAQEGLPMADSLDALLADDRVDAVYIATPNHLHAEQIVAAARAGKHILCEKPMVRHRDELATVVRALAASPARYATAYDQRHHPAHEAMRILIAQGAIGTPTQARIRYACWLPGDWAVDNWRVEAARAGGGAAIDLAPHGLDLVAFLLGEEPVAVTAMLQRAAQSYAVDDGAVLSAAFPSGVLASLSVAYNCPDALPRRRLEVVGTGGMLLAENTMGQVPGGTLTLIDGVDGTARAVPFDAAASPFDRQIDRFARYCLGETDFPGDAARDLALTGLLLDALDTAPIHQSEEASDAA